MKAQNNMKKDQRDLNENQTVSSNEKYRHRN